MSRPEYREAQDIAVLTIEVVYNRKVSRKRLHDAMDMLRAFGKAEMVEDKAIADTFEEAARILEQRALS